MAFPVELEKTQGGLVFKLREGKPVIIEARVLGNAFDMVYEDRPYGMGDRFGGEPRYGNFGEQFDEEIAKRGFTTKVANAYTADPEMEISKEETIYGNHPPIKRPRIVSARIQLYSLNKEAAKEQRSFVSGFAMAWAGK